MSAKFLSNQASFLADIDEGEKSSCGLSSFLSSLLFSSLLTRDDCLLESLTEKIKTFMIILNIYNLPERKAE